MNSAVSHTDWRAWLPKSVLALKQYSKERFLADLIAGVTVGLVALPLAMAFAIASGVPPQAGLYCAVVAGFCISAFGGSRLQVGGPTGAFVVVVAGIVARYGMDGLLMCTGMAGVFLILLGATGLGTAVRYIPRPVVVGFTNGIAVVIASTQIKDFFGFKIEHMPGDFLGRMEALTLNLRTVSPTETALGAGSLVVIVLCSRFLKRVPGYIVALFGGTILSLLLHLNVETIGTKFGGIPAGMPTLHLPQFHLNLVLVLLSPALTVTMLGAIESLMSAVVADRMSGDHHNPNVELIAQGIGNFMSPLFGGLPATGAIARTATNIRSGAQTPVSGMIHALTLLIILMVAAPIARFIPLSVLAAILFVVAYNMGEWHEIPQLLKMPKLTVGSWAVTFFLTVFADLTVAVEAGMILAVLMFIREVSSTTTVSEVTAEYLREGREHTLYDREIPPYVKILRIHGAFLFGATHKLENVEVNTLPKIVILRLRNMTTLDSTGLKALEMFTREVRASGRGVILCGARPQPRRMMHKAEFKQHVGAENLCDNVALALERARTLHAELSTQVA